MFCYDYRGNRMSYLFKITQILGNAFIFNLGNIK